MSQRLIALNPDLQKLQIEGYDIEIRAGHLLIKDVPYVNAQREVKRGMLVSILEMDGDLTKTPENHTTSWAGDQPCHSDGREIVAFKHSSAQQALGGGVVVDHMFSAKAAYRDYPQKMPTSLGRIAGEAQQVDPAVTA